MLAFQTKKGVGKLRGRGGEGRTRKAKRVTEFSNFVLASIYLVEGAQVYRCTVYREKKITNLVEKNKTFFFFHLICFLNCTF